MWKRPVKRERTAQEEKEWEELLKQAREYTGPLATPECHAPDAQAVIPLPKTERKPVRRNTTGKLV